MNFDTQPVKHRSWDVLNKASNQWPHLLAVIGGISSDHFSGRHGPCPACGGTDRFRWITDEGPAGWLCSHCGGKRHQGGGGTGIDLLMRVRGWTFRYAIKQIERYYGDLPFQPAPKKITPLPRQISANQKHSELERFFLLEIAGQAQAGELFSPAVAKARMYSKRWAVYAAANYDSAISAILQFETENGIVAPSS